jgi:hypothetical protein
MPPNIETTKKLHLEREKLWKQMGKKKIMNQEPRNTWEKIQDYLWTNPKWQGKERKDTSYSNDTRQRARRRCSCGARMKFIMRHSYLVVLPHRHARPPHVLRRCSTARHRPRPVWGTTATLGTTVDLLNVVLVSTAANVTQASGVPDLAVGEGVKHASTKIDWCPRPHPVLLPRPVIAPQ